MNDQHHFARISEEILLPGRSVIVYCGGNKMGGFCKSLAHETEATPN